MMIPEGKRFYVATVRERIDNHESKRAMANQTALFTSLTKVGWEIKTSKLRTRRDRIKVDDRVEERDRLLRAGITEIHYKRSREKGIDVKLATDLIVGAVDDKYDTAIVVSSDTDLIPAIQWVRMRMKKRVEYVGFSLPEILGSEATRPVKNMIYNTDIQRVLSEAEIKNFFVKKLFY